MASNYWSLSLKPSKSSLASLAADSISLPHWSYSSRLRPWKSQLPCNRHLDPETTVVSPSAVKLCDGLPSYLGYPESPPMGLASTAPGAPPRSA